MKFIEVALFGAVAVASAQPHRHAHRHADKHLGSPVERRAPDAVTTVVTVATETIYELNGHELSADDVAKGLKAGYYILVSETATPTPKTSTSAAPSPSTSAQAAEFFQKPSSSSTPPASSTPAPASSSSPAAAAPSSSPAASGGQGLNSEFPSGTIPCSTFPSAYGAVAADWLGLNSWIGVQNVPNFTPDVDNTISYISTVPVGSGGGCTPKSYCSYACPAGYQKSQWPAAQGNTGQSIGGLYCNANGMLELSRPSVKQLCIGGTGQVKVTNKLSTNVAICRTDYPGTESETVGMNTESGQTYELTCPDASNYYMHEGSFTSAQYYINPSGVSMEMGCQWQTEDVKGSWHGAPGNIGNWAPVNLGVGKGPAGTTYISLIPNKPTNLYGTLDFNIAIKGDVSGQCEYKNGQFYNNGNADPSGCTVSLCLKPPNF